MSEKENLLEVKAGEPVIHAKRACDGIYLVKEGKLKVYKLDKSNQELPIAVIGPGEFVGETAFFLDQPFSSNVVALTDCKLVKIPRKVLEVQVKAMPSWLLAIVKGLIIRLHKANESQKRNNWVDKNVLDTLEQFKAKDGKKDPAAS